MTSVLEQYQARQDFDQADEERLAILNDVERIKAEPHPSRKEIHDLAQRAFTLAKRDVLYGVQAEVMVDEVAALAAPVAPELEQQAHDAIEKIYADRQEVAQPLISPVREFAHQVLERTVQTSLDLSEDDTLPNIPIPAIIHTAIEEVQHEQEDQLPPNKKELEIGWQHISDYQAEQRRERVAQASPEELSEEDDAQRMDPSELFDDDDENELVSKQERRVA